MKERNRDLRIWGKILVSATVMVAMALGAYAFLTRNFFRVHDIEVQLSNEASYNTTFPNIKEALDTRLRNLHGQYTWRVDLERILRTVENDLRVKDAKVTRVYPDKIQISILPHTPVLNIVDKSRNYLHPVARNGDVLPPVPAREASDSPLLLGEEFLSQRDLRMRALELLEATPATGPFSHRTISEITFDKKLGFEIRLQPTGSLVWMGMDDFRHRSSQVSRVLDYLEREQLTGRIIDARYGKKVVVKLRNDL